MGYNKEVYSRIKAEYSNKYAKAQGEADARRLELYANLPEVQGLDLILSRTGMDIMGVILTGGADVQNRIAEIREKNRLLQEKRDAILIANGYPADYSDVRYECEACADSGYVGQKMCACMRKALTMASYETSGLGALIGTQRFDNFSLDYYQGKDRERADVAHRHLKSFAEGFCGKESYRNYLLLGGTGLGKTHLSTAVTERVIDRGYDVFYVSAVGLLGDFEGKRFGGDAERQRDLSRYYEADLLIVDDLGTEIVNQFTLSCLYDVLNSRMNAKRSTMINTNLSKKELEDKYNERITSRLFGEYYPLMFSGTDVRRQKIFQK